jgi:hypothetical protein
MGQWQSCMRALPNRRGTEVVPWGMGNKNVLVALHAIVYFLISSGLHLVVLHEF